MILTKLLLAVSLVIPATSLFSQEDGLKHCGQTKALQDLYAKHPGLQQKEAALKQQSAQGSGLQKTSTTPYIIPMVFHIVHQYGVENISDAQVIDEVRILNEDYQLRNADTSQIVPSFKNLKANLNIEFRLAKIDPNGNCTNGILHVASPLTNVGDDNVKFDQWDPSKYLNVWVVKTMMSGAAGYAYYPSTADGIPGIDGVVILQDYIGSIGTGGYYKARALTHEIGHYLDLEHTWGGTNNPGVACGDDGVADTPDTQGWTSCNLNGSICNPPVIENVQNYMEYAYCSRMFTLDQKTRMINALTSTVANRNNLWSASNLLATGTDNASFTSTLTCKPTADFKASFYNVCQGSSVTFSDASTNAPATAWQWTFNGGSPASSTASTQVVAYSTVGSYAVKLKVANSQGNDSITKTAYINVHPTASPNSSSLVESFESITVPNTNWIVNPGADAYNWQIATVGATGSRSVKISNRNADENDIDELITPSLNFSTAAPAYLTFKVAFAQTSNGNNTDVLRVYSSKDCGMTWNQRYSKSGASLATTTVVTNSNYTPLTTDWRMETITMPTILISSNTMFKFQFVAGGGNNVYIDDINIGSTVGVQELSNANGLALQVMPNPFSGSATVTIIADREETVAIGLMDVVGKTVLSMPAYKLGIGDNTFTIHQNGLAPGLYLLNVTTGNSRITKKIIIQ